MSTNLNLFHTFSFILFFFFFCLFGFFYFYLFFFVFLGISAICRGCRGIFLEMNSQEERVSIQRFEIGIHKDLPIKKQFLYFFWGGGGEGSSEVLLNGFFSLSFPEFFFTSDK